MKELCLLITHILLLFGGSETLSNNMIESNETIKYRLVLEASKDLLEDPKLEKLELPSIGVFELDQMKMDSLNSYGEGDCWGYISRYSLDDMSIAIDSASCGIYGYSYKYYVLDPDGLISKVYEKKSDPIMDYNTNNHVYINKELVIDFEKEPALFKVRIDTTDVVEYKNSNIQKEFTTENLTDATKWYKYFEEEYRYAWIYKSEE
ncbi:hypothetical protein [Reichenbachiella versicolor]|uniref:hypothetical protein n=1 Tax=Reichenbachiella versicolor TaxID=1821036 RepID=UPI0013A54BB3|nr:hypothetical protein [Reichenbachiella versicolor]